MATEPRYRTGYAWTKNGHAAGYAVYRRADDGAEEPVRVFLRRRRFYSSEPYELPRRKAQALCDQLNAEDRRGT